MKTNSNLREDGDESLFPAKRRYPREDERSSLMNGTRRVTRAAWVDTAKGIAIFLVVLFHASLFLLDAGVQGGPWRAKVALELFPVPAFFLLAGITSFRIVGFSFPDLWRRRLLPLLYLYVVWSVVRFVFYLVVPTSNSGLGDLPADDPRSLLLLLVWPSSSYWFLHALVVFTALAWLIRRLPVAVQLGAAAVVSALTTSGLLDLHNTGWNRIAGLFVVFLIGVRLRGRIVDAVEGTRAIAIVPLAAALAGVIAGMLLWDVEDIPGVVLVGQLLGVSLGLVVARAVAGWRPAAFLEGWGARSLHIYVLHLFVIVPVTSLVELSGWSPPRIVGAILQVALAVGAILVSLALMRWTRRARWLYVPPRSWVRRSSKAPPRRIRADDASSSAARTEALPARRDEEPGDD